MSLKSIDQKKRKRGEITLKILEGLVEFSGNLPLALEAFLNAGYGAQMGRINREFRKIQERNSALTEEARLAHEQEERFYKMVSYLKTDNILKIRRRNGLKEWLVTPKGWRVLDKLRKQLSNNNLPLINYPKTSGDKFIIVLFDIPERERHKRNWLRGVLKHLGLIMLQKSAWAGKIKIPKELLDDLYKLKINECVEIFTVNKAGSLRKIL